MFAADVPPTAYCSTVGATSHQTAQSRVAMACGMAGAASAQEDSQVAPTTRLQSPGSQEMKGLQGLAHQMLKSPVGIAGHPPACP